MCIYIYIYIYVDPHLGPFMQLLVLATWKSLAQPRVFCWEDNAESYVAWSANGRLTGGMRICRPLSWGASSVISKVVVQRVGAAGGFFQIYCRRGKRGSRGDRPRRGRWQKNQRRKELLWDHFEKDRRKSCFGGCREDRRGGAFFCWRRRCCSGGTWEKKNQRVRVFQL